MLPGTQTSQAWCSG